ncbi:hypothetical protein [Devosia sp.]|uniref:hypothetical protein n=1 Tax=Devosia sp. TaxID=1871048 RepID=UPI001AC6D7B7|nr:hypothetical protein [Devosia sp.]MBN9332973.1 hypothetical protein [Devosia sp.]
MATISVLADNGDLNRVEIELDSGRQPWRCLYATPEFSEWAGSALPRLETGVMQAEITPNEQVYALFADFIEGKHFEENKRFRSLVYHPVEHVWELKTVDVRIFGWFAQMDQFVCCFGEHKDVLMDPTEVTRTYGRYILRTNFERERLNLDPPKSVEYKDYANVLSDAD